jgi:hypothetical protein
MIVEFRWEDILNGQVRRRYRAELEDFMEFDLSSVAPTENLRIIVLDNVEHGQKLGEILLRR